MIPIPASAISFILYSSSAICDKHLRVLEDISLVSCNQFPSGEYACLRITTLDQQDSYPGRISILTLLSAINNDNTSVSIPTGLRLIIRESCGAGPNLHFSE